MRHVSMRPLRLRLSPHVPAYGTAFYAFYGGCVRERLRLRPALRFIALAPPQMRSERSCSNRAGLGSSWGVVAVWGSHVVRLTGLELGFSRLLSSGCTGFAHALTGDADTRDPGRRPGGAAMLAGSPRGVGLGLGSSWAPSWAGGHPGRVVTGKKPRASPRRGGRGKGRTLPKSRTLPGGTRAGVASTAS
ncbi:uncharacterized protein LOC115893913 [Rhinopithecus roxellana]|uniref:uncharacterized protein LOC115893913 n=1 Tax=Rhinopithecus roxellana TaxID=61622 RepID=UPI0012379AF3|nr:uncharacterized protein LOC115893913 [Rhinopithecus roxellana]